MIIKKASNKKTIRLSIVLSAVVFLSSFFFVGGGVWLNTYGVLTSPIGILGLVKNAATNIDHFEPIDFYAREFTGVNIERASREGLTGVDLEEFEYSYQPDVADQYIALCWISLLSWVAIAAALILSFKISKARINAQESALPSILGMWCCILGAVVASQLTLLAFNYINASLMFAMAGVGIVIIYQYSKSHTTQTEKAVNIYPVAQNYTKETSASEEVKDSINSETHDTGSVACPVCHKVQMANRQSCYACGTRLENGAIADIQTQ